ncbi:MAG: hypothetical protein IIA90_04895 [Chloroflexi bacterium]|nr:hypothetical protein [Chloroflexota bacterium]
MTWSNAWLWGASCGVLAIIFVGAFFLIREATGGGGDTCDRDLRPRESGSVSAQAFADQDAALKEVVDMIVAGDRARAESALFGPVHDFTYVAQSHLDELDPIAAENLCEWIIRVEDGIAAGASDFSVAVEIDHLRGLLRDAGVALGYPRPGQR